MRIHLAEVVGGLGQVKTVEGTRSIAEKKALLWDSLCKCGASVMSRRAVESARLEIVVAFFASRRLGESRSKAASQ